MPLRDLPPRAYIKGVDDVKRMRVRDDFAMEIGNFLLEGISDYALKVLAGIEWINCHQHAFVNTLTTMCKTGNRMAAEDIGDDRLGALPSCSRLASALCLFICSIAC